MLKQLRFVQGAIGSSKAGVPDMEHYRIRDNRITAFNGRMALSAPFGIALTAYPQAAAFHKAVKACDGAEEVKVKLTEGGKLGIATDTFRAYIPSLPDVDYDPQPEGELQPCPETLLDDLARIAPFIGEDASRGWSMGALFDAGCLTATNNIIIMRIRDDHRMPRINLPGFAIREMLRIAESPTMMQTDQFSITFHYLDGSWLKSQLLALEWPTEIIERTLAVTPDEALEAIPPELRDALATMAGFVDSPASPVYLEDGYITNSPHQQDGTMIAVPDLPGGACFGYRALRLAVEAAEAWDLNRWPDHPCPLWGAGGKLRGVLLGRNR